MKKSQENIVCKTCGKPLEESIKIDAENEEKMISYIKEKALKAAMSDILPLLEKLQEAALQQSKNAPNTAELSYEDQIKNMQDIAREKVKMREMKVHGKMKNLQARIAMRK